MIATLFGAAVTYLAGSLLSKIAIILAALALIVWLARDCAVALMASRPMGQPWALLCCSSPSPGPLPGSGTGHWIEPLNNQNTIKKPHGCR